MAFVWVQQWFALPVVVEDPMGDASSESGPEPAPQHAPDAHPLEVQRQPAYAYSMPPGQAPASAPFNMAAMTAALPDYTSTMSPHRTISGASTSAVVYQLQQIAQYPQPAMAYPPQPAYGPSYGTSQFSPSYPSFAPVQQRPMAHAQLHQPFVQYPQPYMYYPGPFPQPPVAYGTNPASRRASLPTAHPAAGSGLENTLRTTGLVPTAAALNPAGDLHAAVQGQSLPESAQVALANVPPATAKAASDSGHNSLPRGPPRKPRQSGHALWVGNLPPGTTVVDLKDHFSREASKDIESLFLISKSNCAFVNYKTEASCTAAMHRFHDSRFHGVRLVCRLRRSAAPASGVPTGPSAMSIPRQQSRSPEQSASPPPPRPAIHDADTVTETGAKRAVEGEVQEDGPPNKVAEKFFIVKSLTLQDLELSVRNGIWATQSHNEDVLNRAYDVNCPRHPISGLGPVADCEQAAENVYLIFSANKSGEYFGYARMASAISDDGIDFIHSVPETQASEASDTPKSIPTAATEWAPKGRIIDDSARGTIFWEADVSEDEEEENKPDGSVQPVEADGLNAPQTWGKPFRIEWISTNRLPFYRTRGLRNPWNANREVKIARDGTELEPGVGKRLVQMFHRLGPPAAGTSSMPLMPMPSQVAGPQMRPF